MTSSSMHSDCIFCKIIAHEIPAKILEENDKVIVFMSLQNHPLVVTKKHIDNIYLLDKDSAAAIMQEAVHVSRAIKEGLKADGVNLIQNNDSAAGQEVAHFHLHIKPRFRNDDTTLHLGDTTNPGEENLSIFEKIKSAL